MGVSPKPEAIERHVRHAADDVVDDDVDDDDDGLSRSRAINETGDVDEINELVLDVREPGGNGGDCSLNGCWCC